MNAMMMADPLFKVWSPDKVATLLDGVPANLKTRLYGDEFTPPVDDEPMSHFWTLLSDGERSLLNGLAAAHAASVYRRYGL